MMQIQRAKAGRRCWRALRDESGSAAVEFALIAPVFVLILAGTLEIGIVIRERFDLVSVVSAAAHHTLGIGESVDDGSAQQVAATLATLLDGGDRSATVRVNNAVIADLGEDGVAVSDTGADVAACYCPSRPDDALSWGAEVICGTSCADGNTAGRFVEIVARAPYAPLLGTFGLFTDQTLHNSAVVRLP